MLLTVLPAYSVPARAPVDQNAANVVHTHTRTQNLAKCEVWHNIPIVSQRSYSICINHLFQQILSKIGSYISQIESQQFSEVPAGHDITLFFRQLPSIIASSSDSASLALSLSQKSVSTLYSSQSQLQRDCYSALVHVLCQAFPKILKELNSWITYSNDEV
jgi:hypothetical protein